MKLWKVAAGQYTVLAITDMDCGVEYSPALDFLANAPKTMCGQANGIRKCITEYANGGRENLTAMQFDSAGGDDIFKFKRGRLRIYCFKDGDHMVILTHGSLKKGEKTAKADLTIAEAKKAAYLEAKRKNAIVISEVPDD